MYDIYLSDKVKSINEKMTTIFIIILGFLIIVYVCLIVYDIYLSDKAKSINEESYPPIKYVFSPPKEVTEKMLLPDITTKELVLENKLDLKEEKEEATKKTFPQFKISCIPSDRLKAPNGLDILKQSPTYIKILNELNELN